MKKLGVILLVCILCIGTVFATVQQDIPIFTEKQPGEQQIDEPAVPRIMTQATTFEEIKLALKDTGAFDNYRKYNFFNFGYAVDDAEVMMDANASMDMGSDMAMPEESVNTWASGAEDGSSKDFSSTNVQIEGIDEADIIKTDGDYLYIVGGRIIYIVTIDESDMEIVSKIDKTEESVDINSIFIDKDRLGCVGASFGGFSVYWLAGHHDKRFKAFIAHDGIFNMEMQYLETEEMWFANWDMGGAYWDKSNATAQRTFANSPHRFVDKWDTPILCIHGEKDYRILANQGMAAFNAAVLRGVPAELLIYPDENHWVLKPQNSILWQRTFFEWLDKWLKK